MISWDAAPREAGCDVLFGSQWRSIFLINVPFGIIAAALAWRVLRARVTGRALEAVMLRLAPMAIELIAFAAIFRVVPHRTVKWRHAFVGALLSVLLFELVKWGIAVYLRSFNSYQKIYGPLEFIPVFLLWIFFGWVSILFGASSAASLAAFRYQPVAMRLPEGFEIYGLLRMLGRFAERRLQGRGLHSEEIRRLEPMLTDELVQELLAQLCVIGLLSRAESGEWMLARDLDTLTMADLYEACQLRIPIAEALLPLRNDALGTAALAELDQFLDRIHPTDGRQVPEGELH